MKINESFDTIGYYSIAPPLLKINDANFIEVACLEELIALT